MQREILFKAKRKDNNEWVYGDLIQLLGEQGKGRKLIVDNRFGACIDDKGNFINTEAPFVNEVIPETICQYTELTDKNGVKIFENDIVKAKYEENNGYIKWNSENASFQVKGIPSHTLKRADELEVIGNIFDEGVNNANTTN